MNTGDTNFFMTFNEYYPFERYIIRKPESINYLFDDAILTEVFVPSTEFDNPDTSFDEDKIYVKLICKGVEFRLAYFDFNEGVRETIRGIVYNDIGGYEWESLYVEYEDKDDYQQMADMLKKQKELITNKYGICNIKSNFKITDTIEIINKL